MNQCIRCWVVILHLLYAADLWADSHSIVVERSNSAKEYQLYYWLTDNWLVQQSIQIDKTTQKTVAFATSSSNLVLSQSANLQPKHVAKLQLGAGYPAFLAKQNNQPRLFFMSTNRQLQTINTQTASLQTSLDLSLHIQVKQQWQLTIEDVFNHGWRRLLLATSTEQMLLFDISNNEPKLLWSKFEHFNYKASHLVILPNKQWVIVQSYQNQLLLFDPTTSEKTAIRPLATQEKLAEPALLADRNTGLLSGLYSADEKGNIWFFDFATLHWRHLWRANNDQQAVLTVPNLYWSKQYQQLLIAFLMEERQALKLMVLKDNKSAEPIELKDLLKVPLTTSVSIGNQQHIVRVNLAQEFDWNKQAGWYLELNKNHKNGQPTLQLLADHLLLSWQEPLNNTMSVSWLDISLAGATYHSPISVQATDSLSTPPLQGKLLVTPDGLIIGLTKRPIVLPSNQHQQQRQTWYRLPYHLLP